MNEEPYLVTGASGFVGRHLLQTHAREGAGRRALALVRDSAAWRRADWTREFPHLELVEGSVNEPKRWAASLPELGGIFHLAAVVRHSRRNPEDIYQTNVAGTLEMVRLAAARGCRLLVVSTSGTVGCFRNPDQYADEQAPYAEEEVSSWPYYDSKIQLERRARALAEDLGVDLVVIRPPVLLGPGDHRYRSTATVLKAIRRKLPFLIRGGMHFADVRDAARAILRAMEQPAARPIYHLEGTECSIEEFFGMIEDVSGVPKPPLLLPYRPARLLARALERFGVVPDPVVIEMASRYWGARSLYAAQDLGYKPRDPRETLRDTVDWLRAHPQ